MSELTRCFDRVVVINLPSRRDRYDEMGEQLRCVGLGWDSPQVMRFAAERPAAADGFPSIGAHGCFLSHVGAIEQAIAAGVESLLLLEDDCNFGRDFGTRMPTINAALRASDWSIFYGGGHLHGAEPPRAESEHPIVEVSPEQPIWLTHCVAVRGVALEALAAWLRLVLSRPAGHPDGGRMDVDGAYSWLRRLNPQFKTVIASPQIAYQRSSRTDVSAPSWADRAPVVRDLLGIARRLRNRRRA